MTVRSTDNPVLSIARAARGAARRLAVTSSSVRDRALEAIARELVSNGSAILEANRLDCDDARTLVTEGAMAASLYDRLVLDEAKLASMASSVRAVAALPDPTNELLQQTTLDDGLVLDRVSCPLGVLAVIFESRPDAVTQISALAIKSANAVILKGGRESLRSARALVDTINRAIAGVPEMPEGCVSLLSGREETVALLALDEYVDLVIPRGGNDLVRFVQEQTRIPVLGHAEGVCHVYVDRAADPLMALGIVRDSKLQYPAACNAVETLLVHCDVAQSFLSALVDRLGAEGVELRGCDATRSLVPQLAPASDGDWRTEYSAPILAVKIVGSLTDAIEHINTFGSHHTDAIVTGDPGAAERFLAEVDSAGVYHNASTRFADGYRYGLGAEVGISTNKLHARGPVGLEGLVSYKYLLRGEGHVVATYAGPGARRFRHS